jgi:hypothetical protein
VRAALVEALYTMSSGPQEIHPKRRTGFAELLEEKAFC